MTAPSTAALRLAAEWLDEYEPAEDELEEAAELAAVAELLRAMADRRDLERARRATAREVAAQTGLRASDPRVLAAVRKAVPR